MLYLTLFNLIFFFFFYGEICIKIEKKKKLLNPPEKIITIKKLNKTNAKYRESRSEISPTEMSMLTIYVKYFYSKNHVCLHAKFKTRVDL